EPPHPKRRRERLADRADVDDLVGCQTLESTERAPVVAELRVVVVLDHERPTPTSPGREHLPPRAVERATSRIRMRGGDQDCVDAGCCEQSRIEPALVDGDGHGLESGRLDRGAMPAVAGLLDGHATRARATEYAAEKRQALREASADEDPVRCDDDAAHA